MSCPQSSVDEASDNNESEHSLTLAPYCTHKCLLGLSKGDSALDMSCPNAELHDNDGHRHQINQESFLDRLRQQLSDDNNGLVYTGVHCGTGYFYQLRLQSHGYSVVAKGYSDRHTSNMNNEVWIYDELRMIQGEFVPVCLDVVVLGKPDYQEDYMWEEVHSLLLLSFAGDPITDYLTKSNCYQLWKRADLCLSAIHVMGVLHREPWVINVVMDGEDGQVMVIDFETSENIWDYEKEKEEHEDSKREFLFEKYLLKKDFAGSV